MSAERIIYRTRQFWHALGSEPSAEEMALVDALLTPPQRTIFTRMHKSEQVHGLLVLNSLQDLGENDKDLLVAALLHDVGKSRFPLHLWERVVIVLAKKICPACVRRWGETGVGKDQTPRGWRRAFIIAERHPTWGAEIAAQVGCSRLTANLIRRHQETIPVSECDSIENRLLLKLQAADNES
jgi:putative nucleotidyltransferase with HDIG domain